MDIKSNYKYLLSDLTALKGVGVKTKNLLKKKKINNLFDLLWKLPKSYTDRSLSSKIKELNWKRRKNDYYNKLNKIYKSIS